MGSWGSHGIFTVPSRSWLSYVPDGESCNPTPNNPGLSPPTSSELKVPLLILSAPGISPSVCSAGCLVCFPDSPPSKAPDAQVWLRRTGRLALSRLHSSRGHGNWKAQQPTLQAASALALGLASLCWYLKPAYLTSALLSKESGWYLVTLNMLQSGGLFWQTLSP